MPKMHVLNLRPDQDVTEALREYTDAQDWKGAVIMAGLGSVYNVTYANPITRDNPPKVEMKSSSGPSEVVSFIGEILRRDDPTADVPRYVWEADSKYLIHVHISFSAEGGIVGGGFRDATVLRALNIYMTELE